MAVSFGETDLPNMVFFDLETTGLGPSCDIVQLAAVSGHHTLNLFMVPRCRMEPGASRITGFRVRRHRLFLHRRPVLTNSLKEALVSFITFLRMFGRPLLVGHNIRRFDCLVLARVLDEFDLKAVFQAGIVGFLDSLPLTRQLLKHRGVHSFKQENLVKTVLGVSYAAHNALGDVQALQKLYWALGPRASQIQQHIFSLDSLCKRSKDRITCVNSKSDSNGEVQLLQS
ncbi:three prime repair exonuclease 4 [Ictalurus punctatus]|uniref:exodeoxyribonuclease III n=1 Tax=Ictalurus punctatus TaxID=7998 RepID=A0A2D0SHD1_ICTPU|nr:three prime repair exonuclease 4 [Ictalurus punctatus]